MKRILFIGLALSGIVATTIIACKRNVYNKFDAKGTIAGTTAVCTPNVCSVQATGTETIGGVLAVNKTLTNDRIWILNGKLYVTNNARLIINPGTIIRAVNTGNPATASAIIITRGARIQANGTSTCPIVFTSNSSVPASGDWGGIVLLGRAPINKPDTDIEGIIAPIPAGVDIQYGGGGAGLGIANDNSGILRYVRIEYAGVAVATDNELNGLTCGGVGNGTTLDYIQVYKGNDDAFQFFGGTVNAKHLYAYVPDDDAFDFSLGYTGNIQFAVSILNDIDDYAANPNGIEGQNDAIGTNDMPYTRPVLSNFTILGVCDSADSKRPGDILLHAAHFRRNSRYIVRNSIFAGFPVGFYPSGGATSQTLLDTVYFRNNLVQAFDIPLKMDPLPGTFSLNTITTYRTDHANTDIKLVDPCLISCPDFTLQAISPALSGTDFTGLPAFFTTTTYRGAFAGSGVVGANWLQGWTKH